MRSFSIYTALSILAFIAMMLPIAGAGLDHHFAQRMPTHSHVYLGPVDLDHSHDVDPTAVTDEGQPDGGTVVFTVDSDAAGSGAVSFIGPGSLSVPRTPAITAPMYLSDLATIGQANVHPDPPPPRA